MIGALSPSFAVMQCHGYEVTALPADGAPVLARSPKSRVQAFRVGKSLGLQFHPEWTRDAFRAVLASNREWASSSGYRWDELTAESELRFDACRSTGDRLLTAWLDHVGI